MSTAIDASELLIPSLLEGVTVVLAGPPTGASGQGARTSLAGEVAAACSALGALVLELPVDRDHPGAGGDDEQELGRAAERLLAAGAGAQQVLVIDGAGLFAHALALASGGSDAEPESARAALRACLEASWSITHALVNSIFLPGARGGRIVYLAPAGDAGEHAQAARSGLENLARTLSIEWARHGITTVAVAPASGSADAGSQVAALTAYLASRAGAYFSGCLLDLRGLEGGGGASSPRDSV
jgi:NAD(P)-dependent dehydrogenase (short-subunit alcohol dehydrogenase family)